VDITKRGLTAHLQTVVLDVIVQEQMEAFEARLRASLEEHVRGITIGAVEQVKNVLKLRDELLVKVEVDFQDPFQDVEAPRHA